MIDRLYQIYRSANGVSIDSRKVEPGQLFFAIKGERFDGNDYAVNALEAGAIAAVVDRPDLVTVDGCMLVPDAKTALQSIATYHRRQFDIPVICITGSNGKTTTKELISRVLNRKFKTHSTSGNFNNLIGLPLTILAMPLDTEIAVLEIGMSLPGEIRKLCEIAEPTHGLVTNIGRAHLEGMGSMDAIIDEKSSLFDYIAENRGTVFYNRDEKYLEERSEHVHNRIAFGAGDPEGSNETCDLMDPVSLTPEIQFRFGAEGEIWIGQSRLMGLYNFRNIAAAVEIGKFFQVSPKEILAAVSTYSPDNNRSQIVRKGKTTILLDAYNANHTSVIAALKTLCDWPVKHKIAVLGDMLEGGRDSVSMHQDVIEQLVALGIREAYLVGTEYRKTDTNHYPVFEDVKDLRKHFQIDSTTEAIILIKGSRGIGLERFIEEN